MIFYFTGTGNSLYIAKQLDENIVSIPQVIHNEALKFTADKIGVVCPIYGHEMPKMVKEFLAKAEFDAPYFYIILTYGALHGGAAELAQSYLQSIGKSADYINSIVMVDNFLPNFDMEKQRKLNKKIDKNLSAIKADLAEEKRMVQKAGMQKFVHTMYLKMVKNQPETVWASYKVEDACIGCGICEKVCPASCVSVVDGRAKHELTNCQACYACVNACPQKAIKFNLAMQEKNPNARYRHEGVSLEELIQANNQTK